MPKCNGLLLITLKLEQAPEQVCLIKWPRVGVFFWGGGVVKFLFVSSICIKNVPYNTYLNYSLTFCYYLLLLRLVSPVSIVTTKVYTCVSYAGGFVN